MKIDLDVILEVGCKVDPEAWTLSDILAKIMEEAGEFSCATQIKAGKINKTQPVDEDINECADVIITVIDALARNNKVYDGTASEQEERRKNLTIQLQSALHRKCNKWEQKIAIRPSML